MFETCGSTNTTPILELSDDLEVSYAVEGLHKYMTTEGDSANITNLDQHVIRLAKKYECPDILTRIELAVYRQIASRPGCGCVRFGCAATLKVWPACGQIIASLDDNGKAENYQQAVVDPGKWSPSKVRSLAYGTMFMWGINRAAIEAYQADTGMDYKRMGRLFIGNMEQTKQDVYYQPYEQYLRMIEPSQWNEERAKRRKLG